MVFDKPKPVEEGLERDAKKFAWFPVCTENKILFWEYYVASQTLHTEAPYSILLFVGAVTTGISSVVFFLSSFREPVEEAPPVAIAYGAFVVCIICVIVMLKHAFFGYWETRKRQQVDEHFTEKLDY